MFVKTLVVETKDDQHRLAKVWGRGSNNPREILDAIMRILLEIDTPLLINFPENSPVSAAVKMGLKSGDLSKVEGTRNYYV